MQLSVRLLSVTVVVAGASLLGAPAQSAASDYPGVSGRLNLWEHDGYDGCYEGRETIDTDFGNDSCHAPASFNDRVSSVVNKTARWWVMYEDRGSSGARVCVRPRSHDGNIGNDTDYEDDISSVERKGTSKPAGCDDVTGSSNG